MKRACSRTFSQVHQVMETIVVLQIKCRNFSFLLLNSISSASKLRQWQVRRTEICAAKIRKFSRIYEKSAASAKDLKNPQRRIVLVNDLLQIVFSSALPSSSISASSFDLNNYNLFWPQTPPELESRSS